MWWHAVAARLLDEPCCLLVRWLCRGMYLDLWNHHLVIYVNPSKHNGRYVYYLIYHLDRLRGTPILLCRGYRGLFPRGLSRRALSWPLSSICCPAPMCSLSLEVSRLNIREHFSRLMRATCPWHLILFDFITLVVVGDDFKSWSSKYSPQQSMGVEMCKYLFRTEWELMTVRFQHRLCIC